jgi:tripartite-type tricarboxylate transporter receptor subunit TctC
VEAGKLRSIAQFGATRAAALSTVPTLKEQGIDLALRADFGFFAPKGLPAEVRDLQTAFFAARQRHAAEVERVERAAARAYWKAHPRHGIADKFFDDAGEESIPRRMARIYPGWW